MKNSDIYSLGRFLSAQNPVYDTVLSELRQGKKRTHWMWYIFPQAAGLGRSSTSRHFAINSLAEARAYLKHPILGKRLVECAEVLLGIEGKTAHDIFGYPDDLKLRSCVTLFAGVAGTGSVFEQVLEKYYHGERCRHTKNFLHAPEWQYSTLDGGVKSDFLGFHSRTRVY